MKKFFLILIIVVGTLTARASLSPAPTSEESNYTYLTFEMTDGAKVSVPVSSLTITISGNTLTAGSQAFTLSNLKKMYFSTSDESTTTGIEEIANATLDEATEIYDLNGRKMGNGDWSDGKLPKGVYIVKTKNKTFKMLIK